MLFCYTLFAKVYFEVLYVSILPLYNLKHCDFVHSHTKKFNESHFFIFHENFKHIISRNLLILTLKEQCKYKLPFSNKQDHYIDYILKTNCYSREKQSKTKTSTTQNLQKAELLKFPIGPNWEGSRLRQMPKLKLILPSPRLLSSLYPWKKLPNHSITITLALCQ